MAKPQAAKVKKKLWVNILAPKILNEKVIGEAYVAESGLLVGKNVSCNLANITNNMRNQNINMKFVVTEIRDNKAKTRPVSFELSSTYIKRMMRRKKKRVDESVLLKTADNKTVRMKMFLLTSNDGKSSSVSRLRTKLKEEIKSMVGKSKYEELFNDIISHRFQSKLKSVLNKITPLKVCEVRVLKEEREKQKIGEKQVIEESAEEETEQEKPKKEKTKEEKPEKKKTEDIKEKTPDKAKPKEEKKPKKEDKPKKKEEKKK
jgi:small subunit ribosomal protein S3Ae